MHLAMFRSFQRFRRVAWPKAKALVDNNPLLANALIYGGLYTMAEVSQQTIQQSLAKDTSSSLVRDSSVVAKLDMSSVKRYAIMGTVCISPLLTKWYGWLDGKFPCTTTRVVIKKLFLDQFIFTPVVVVVFYVGMSYLEGERGLALLDELKEKGLQTFFMDCCFWLPASAINFMFVPAWLRVAFIGLSSFLWLNVLCWIKSWPTGRAVTPTCSGNGGHHIASKCEVCS